MDIAKIDRNFALPGKVEREDITWYDAAEAPFMIYGATGKDPYCRMPREVAERVSAGVLSLHGNTAGIRARFRTDSPYIAIRAEWNEQRKMAHMPFVGICGFDLYRLSEKGNRQFYVRSFVPPVSCDKGYESIVDTSGTMTDYILNFPLYNNVCKLYIGVKQGSAFAEPRGYTIEKPVVFYGSSITQGGCASRPGTCYQNFLSRALDMDYVNLGFSGNGKAEDEMIEYLAGLEMAAFVSDYDHNAPNAEHLLKTHEKLYREIRKKHPDLPYVIISMPNFLFREDQNARRSIIMETFRNALAEGDRNVYFLDGASIFAGDESDACLVDLSHPTDLGFYRFFKALQPILEHALYS